MLKLALVVATLLCGSLPASPPAAAPNTLFEVAISPTFVNDLMQMKVDERTTIHDRVEKTLVVGTALTRGNVRVQPYPDLRVLGIDLELESETNATTINRNEPRPDVSVRFDWSIRTKATTVKRLWMDEGGLSWHPARTRADSSITIHNVETYAQGLFPRLKRVVAENEARRQLNATREENERKAAAKIATQLDSLVDQRSEKLLADANTLYRELVHRPLIGRRFLGGRLRFLSLDRALVVTGVREPGRGASLPSLGFLHGGNAAVIRIYPGLLSNLVASRFAGATFSDVDIAELLTGTETDFTSVEDAVGSPDEVVMTFSRTSPVDVGFDQDRIEVTLRLDELLTKRRTLNDVLLTRTFAIHREGGGLSIAPEGELDVRSGSPMPLAPEVLSHIRARLSRVLIAKTVELSRLKLPPAKRPLGIRDAQAREGSLTVLLAPKGRN